MKIRKSVVSFLLLLSLLAALGIGCFAESTKVFFEGTQLESGLTVENGKEYVRLSETAQAEGISVKHESGSDVFSFDWRLSSVDIDAAASTITYEKDTSPLPCIKDSERDDLLVPVYEFCDALDIGTYNDEEFGTLYCTAASGNWELPSGYDVAVMMYHATGSSGEGDNLVMPPEHLREQFEYLNNNGYTTIWFEDLWNVANISKPVILVFDDGWSNNYRHLLPLLEEYKVKATIAVVKKFTDEGSHIHLTSDEIKEMVDSGYVSIQSHTVTHTELAWLNKEQQAYEMDESKRFITRLVGKEPCALIYPTGSQNGDTLDLLPSYYRFGVKMLGKAYNTSDDPRLIYRFFPENYTILQVYQQWLEGVFGRPE